MLLIEDSDGLLSYDYSNEPIRPWRYSALRPWMLASNITATILDAVTDHYIVLFEATWNDGLQQELVHYTDLGWEWNSHPTHLQGRNAVVTIGLGRMIFPNCREALEQAARCAFGNGIFVIPEAVPRADLVDRARDLGFIALGERLKTLSTAFILGSYGGVEVEIFSAGMEDPIKAATRFAIAIWDDPASRLRET